jgi:hypothetical protein
MFILAFFLFPLIGRAQYFPPDRLAENTIDKTTGEHIKRTHWHVLQRAVIRNPLNTFYRLSKINDDYYLELKVVKGDVKPFVVAKYEELRLGLEPGCVVTLRNTEYTRSCAGCGSRADRENGPQGVLLTYPIKAKNLSLLQQYYVNRVRIYFNDMFFESPVKERNGEILMESLWLLDHDPLQAHECAHN